MFGQPYLTKRGNVYQWRRRVRQLSTRIVDLKLSLRTTDLRSALNLSRRISAESDIVMQDLSQQLIAADQACNSLAAVIRKDRAKIEKQKNAAPFRFLRPRR